jgi:hypothetical protein
MINSVNQQNPKANKEKVKNNQHETVSGQKVIETISQAPMPVILATQEAEIMRIWVQNQHQENILQDPILKKKITKRASGVATPPL